jgi:serpin B
VSYWEAPSRSDLVRADNEFGFDLMRELVKVHPESNIVISPLSISLALGMTMNGAAGETYDDMRAVLGFSGYSPEAVNQAYQTLMELLVSLDPDATFEVANSVWCQDGVPFEEPFLEVCYRYFDALARALDFQRPDASDIINAWVAEKTHDKILEIVDDNIDPLTKIILINAIYFNGAWREAFDPERTFGCSFTLPDGTRRMCRMMYGPDSCNHYTAYSGPSFHALDMAYGDSVFSMTVFLPSEGRSISKMLDDFNQTDWTTWMSGFDPWCGVLYMPRFEVEYGVKMKDVLTSLGMGIIFDPMRADFSRMCTVYGDFYIKRVMHKTYVRVDERGTEAAAVTEVEGGPTSIPPQFLVTRPFVFVIRENRLNTILFIGQITDPGYFTD